MSRVEATREDGTAFPASFLAGDPEAVSAWDDLPLWSAPFGQVLLEAVRPGPDLRALDVGCGTGFPLLELADRLGPGALVWGLDPWGPALERVRLKARARGVANVQVVQAPAEEMPLEDASFDLIVSNNGLNNVQDALGALRECRRVARPGAQLVFTANLPETFSSFYRSLEKVLGSRGEEARLSALRRHIREKRKPAAEWVRLATLAGWDLRGLRRETFAWTFADGSAFLSHAFIRLAFLPSWRALLPEGLEDQVLGEVEDLLDGLARLHRGLRMEVPFLCLDCMAA
ncbi:MAG: methyltransferase domain-containing protein [Acidobacteria bacterium]|nr:methyltransferase domain-containing protein [Acidobacteriota bacterium]